MTSAPSVSLASSSGRSAAIRRRARCDRHLEPRRIDRLQQIVDRVDLERLDRVLIEGRDEDDVRRRAAAVEHPARHLEAGQPRHLHVEKHDIGLQPLDRRQRLDAVAGLADDLDAADLPEQVAQLVARQLLVVDEHGAQVHASRRHPLGQRQLGNLDAGAGALARARSCSFRWQLAP